MEPVEVIVRAVMFAVFCILIPWALLVGAVWLLWWMLPF